MNERDKAMLIERYEARQQRLGVGPAALGEPKRRQPYIWHFLLDMPDFKPDDSVLDVGCGYGDLHAFLRRRGHSGRYTGIDIVPGLIDAGRVLHPDVDLRVLDIEVDELERRYDWVVACGSLSSATRDVDYYQHLQSMLGRAWALCEKGIAFNLFSPYVDFQRPEHVHVDISRILDMVSALSHRFVLRHDYMPYECAFHVYRADAIDRELSIFSHHRERFDSLRTLHEP